MDKKAVGSRVWDVRLRDDPIG